MDYNPAPLLPPPPPPLFNILKSPYLPIYIWGGSNYGCHFLKISSVVIFWPRIKHAFHKGNFTKVLEWPRQLSYAIRIGKFPLQTPLSAPLDLGI